MSNDTQGDGDLNADEVAELDNLDLESISSIDPETATPEQVALLQKTALPALHQRAKFKAKAIDPATGKPYKDLLAEAQAKPHQPKETPKATPAEIPDEINTRLSAVELSEQKRQFGHAKGLSPEEVDHVFTYANGVGKKPEEVLEAPFVKAGLEALRTETRTHSAIPGPSNRSPKVGGKAFSEMTEKEREESFPQVVAATTRRSR
jgi:hypothetical protein